MVEKIKVGYTTGVFDLFHIGHLILLKKAKSFCDKLVVGVTTDDLVLYKGKKAVIPFEERIEIHPIDPSGKSNVDSSYFYYKNGDAIVVQCFFFSKNVNYDDGLKVSITTDEYVDWLETKAYN